MPARSSRRSRAAAAAAANGCVGSGACSQGRSLGARPTAANRAAGGSPSANRPGPGSSARRAGTTGCERQRPRPALVARDRQHMADRRVEALLEHARAGASRSSGSSRRASNGIDVDRQLALAPQVVPRRPRTPGRRCRDRRRAGARALAGTRAASPRSRRGRRARRRNSAGSRPDRLAVLAPEQVQRPARQLLARIPLALAEVQQAACAVLAARSASISSTLSSALGRTRAPRCSTRRPRGRRSRRRSARRPASGARRRRRRSASTWWPSASIAAHCASV